MPSSEYASLPPGTNGVEISLRSFGEHIQPNGLSLTDYKERADSE